MLAAICCLALAGLIAALAHAFPQALRGGQDWMNVAYLAGVLVLITAGAFRAGRVFRPQHLRYLAIWLVIAAVLALAFAYRAELGFAPDPLDRRPSGERTI